MSKTQFLRAVKGMNDVHPEATQTFLCTSIWQNIFSRSAQILEGYGYQHVWLPIVEETALFARSIGGDTDIVTKEMYTFSDRKERLLSLRPEGTAGAVRAYLENNLYHRSPVQRWWYGGPMFRSERPQKGRYRQFYQIGAELFGIEHPNADVELIVMLHALCRGLGLENIRIVINSVGDTQSRKQYSQSLADYFSQYTSDLCASCQHRLGANPMRILDCKNAKCKSLNAEAPDIIDYLSKPETEHFETVQNLLGQLNLSFVRNKCLVRGLDYYTGTTFEFCTSALGAQDAILGGGRYNNLIAQLGGPSTAAIGFALGVERLALLLSQTFQEKTGPDLYIIPMNGYEVSCFQLAQALRDQFQAIIEVDVSGNRMKQQMRRADKLAARFAMVVGEDEIKEQRVQLKNLQSSETSDIALEAKTLAKFLRHEKI